MLFINGFPIPTLYEDTEDTEDLCCIIPYAPKKPKLSSKSKHAARIGDLLLEEQAARERAGRGKVSKKRRLLEQQLLEQQLRIIEQLNALED